MLRLVVGLAVLCMCLSTITATDWTTCSKYTVYRPHFKCPVDGFDQHIELPMFGTPCDTNPKSDRPCERLCCPVDKQYNFPSLSMLEPPPSQTITHGFSKVTLTSCHTWNKEHSHLGCAHGGHAHVFELANHRRVCVVAPPAMGPLSRNDDSDCVQKCCHVDRTKFCQPPSTEKTHMIESGDSFYSIAQRYSTSVNAIQRLNPGLKNLIPGKTQVRVKTNTLPNGRVCFLLFYLFPPSFVPFSFSFFFAFFLSRPVSLSLFPLPLFSPLFLSSNSHSHFP